MEKEAKNSSAKERGKISRIISELLATAFSMPNGRIPEYDEIESIFYKQVNNPLQFSQNK